MLNSTSRPQQKSGNARTAWRGVYFNPQFATKDFPWLLFYSEYRARINTALKELADKTGMNLVDVFVLIPNSLKKPAVGNRVGEATAIWANTTFLDNVAAFVDDCHDAGLSVELDLADNRWIPYSVDSVNHIGKPEGPWWPVADDNPWDEAAAWYKQVIEYVEAHTAHPESIAMWCMMGNYTWGGAEPVLWNDDGRPTIITWTERFVKAAWPVFRSAGHRPKAAPILLPIFASNGYWQSRRPLERLGGFSNLKRWVIDELKMPPDYWVMSTYPYCDPASDGFNYLKAIINILGPGSATRILSTDLKGEGHQSELRDTLIKADGKSGSDMLKWHMAKCAQYRFAGWWMWAYQDTADSSTGLRGLDGRWKPELLKVIREGTR